MTERLFQFIWQFQYFNRGELVTTEGEPIEVIFPGFYNTNQGPDFLDAQVRIGNTLWAGSVELHILASDWLKHHHQEDSNYNNVILHVVWEDDGDKIAIPLLELKGRISRLLLQRYEELMGSSSFIPCERKILSVPQLAWESWKDRLLAERLLRKSQLVQTCQQQNNNNWEETFWWLIARNFGIKVNAEAFEAIARSIPMAVLVKHKTQIHQLEALLLGQAGLLNENFREDYPRLLQKEYKFYKNKYRLKPGTIPVFFLRMRPGNFPSIRLAQLAMLIHGSAHLFTKIKEAISVKDVKSWFDVTANDYWHYHYRFEEESKFKKKNLGAAMADNIIINTAAPVLFAYGEYHNEQKYKDKAVKWLEETAGETNSITKGFHELGMENRTAVDSQALTELKNEYCEKKRCLECGVGNALFKVL
ncbi:MAG: DUF2851 family protein [Chitinophagaceae bacterium]